jgi:hypothetical protein
MAAAVLVWRQRHIVSTFRKAAAIDAAHARTLRELGIRRDAVVRRLGRHGVLVDSGGGVYYLDETAYAHRRALRREIAVVVFVAIVLFAAIMIYWKP